jgi:hypothetical protein
MEGFNVIPGIKDTAKSLSGLESPSRTSSAIEFIIEGLHLPNELNWETKGKGTVYK